MKISGVQKTSFIDYPGKASTVVFFGGCNFRCGYCHNPAIVKGESQVSQEELWAFLQKRRRFLDAVVISGGEPTLQDDLVDFIMKVRSLGYQIKLDTNGARPEVLRALLDERLVEYVAMDLKGPLARYSQIARTPVNGERIAESVDLLRGALAPEGDFTFELRTTVAKELLSEKDLLIMCETAANAPKWYLQRVRGDGQRLDREGTYTPYSEPEMALLAARLTKRLEEIALERETTTTCVSVR